VLSGRELAALSRAVSPAMLAAGQAGGGRGRRGEGRTCCSPRSRTTVTRHEGDLRDNDLPGSFYLNFIPAGVGEGGGGEDETDR